MDIHLSAQAIIGLVSGFLVVIGLCLLAIRWLLNALIEITHTNIKLNNEMAENSQERLRTAAEISAVRDDCTSREEKVINKLAEFERDARERETKMQNEIDALKRQIGELEAEIERLQTELAKSESLRELDRADFQRQINDKNAEIATLKAQRAKLERRLVELEAAMNGKADKPPTDDVTDSARRATDDVREGPDKTTQE